MSGTAEQSKTGSGWVTPIELTLLGAIWGASFLFMRIAARDFGPFALVEVRLSLGALVLLPFLWRSRTGSLRALSGGWPVSVSSIPPSHSYCLPGAPSGRQPVSARSQMP